MQGFSAQTLSESETNTADDAVHVVKFSLLDKYLNYDISESLKASLKEAFTEWKSQGTEVFVLDLKEVTIVDSCGVGVLILQNAAKSLGGDLALIHLSGFLTKILKMMHLENYFGIFESESEVLDWTTQHR